MQVRHPRLHGRRAIGVIDIEDAVHLGEAEDDGIFLGYRAAGKRGAGAARNDGNAVAMAIFHDRSHFRCRARQGNGERQAAIGHEGVGFEGHEFARLVDQTLRGQQIGQIGDDRTSARQNIRTRLQK